MKMYEVVFDCPEQGFIRQWRRNKKQVDGLVEDWAAQFPLRSLLRTKYVDIPEGKDEFVDWLNDNATRVAL